MRFFKDPADPNKPIPDYFRTQKLWLILLGVWPPITVENRILRYFLVACHRVLQAFLCLVNLHVAAMFYITFALELGTGSFARISYCLSQAIIFSFATFSLCYMQMRAESCMRLVDFMNANFHLRSAAGLTFVTSHRSQRITSFITSTFVNISEVSVIQWAVYPFFRQERTLPLLCWYPFDQLASPMYEFIFVIQTIAQFELAQIFCTSSSFFLSASMMICGQYDILFCSLKNMQDTAMIRNGNYKMELLKRHSKVNIKQENRYSRLYMCEEKLDNLQEIAPKLPLKRKSYPLRDNYQMNLVDEINESLCDCIRHHQIIVECCTQLENLSSPWLLVKSIQISFQICLLSLTFVKSTGSIVNIVNTAQYIILTLTDLFIISYMGQIVQNQSVRVRDFLFETPWYNFGAPVRRSIIIILMYTMRPRLLTGGKFFIMGYDKCIAIVKLSFSYFTLLNTVAGTE